VVTKYRKSKTKKAKCPAGYDSRLEYDLANNELKQWEYHPKERVSYVIQANYEPDFLLETPSKTFLLEVKGRFRTRSEASKYIHVRTSLEEARKEGGKEKELIFFFQDSKKPMPGAQRRKDGTRQTHGNWAEKNGFRFFCLRKGLPASWEETI